MSPLPMMLRGLLVATSALATLATAAPAAAAAAGSLASVEIRDRASGASLPLYRHRGRLYVAGEPGREYEIVISNPGPGRLLAVTSVDGVNVISGETATPAQSGYVLDAWDGVTIDGWRKSLAEVAAFYFTALPDSYAARTGRPRDVGVIGVALFEERQRPEPRFALRAAPAPEAAADAAASAEAGARASGKLGTGHGERRDSAARHVAFERATRAPAEVIAIYYDSYRNLVAQGVIPRERRYAQRRPQPFPGGFVPDP